MQLSQLFCKALWKPLYGTFTPIRTKQLFSVSLRLQNKLNLLTRRMKNGSVVLGHYPYEHSYEDDTTKSYYIIPRSIMFFKIIQEPWACHVSNSNNRIYFYNKYTKNSLYELPSSASLNCAETIRNRIVWNLDKTSDVSLTTDNFICKLEMLTSQKEICT